jgi:signal transduction histidine kinase
MGWVEILRMPDLQEEQRKEAVEEIENDVERLQRVANRFNDIGSMPKLQAQDIRPIIENTAQYIRRRIPEHGQRVDLNVNVPEGLTAPVNEELFGWVVENLLKNALDAIEEPEGTIEVSAFQQNGQVCVEVRDTGCGIDRREWKNVFRPGFSTKQRGWGLGLSLAQRVIENYHGGDLSVVESTVGEGSTFRIEVPAEEAA